MSEPIAPLIVRVYEQITVKEAIYRTGLSDKTIRRYFDEYRLGAKANRNSPLQISYPGLMMVKHGDFDTLELLRAGHRDHPSVVRYYVELGYVLQPSKPAQSDQVANSASRTIVLPEPDMEEIG